MRREQFGNFPQNDQLRRYQFDQNQPGRFAHVKDAPVLEVGKNQFPPQYFSFEFVFGCIAARRSIFILNDWPDNKESEIKSARSWRKKKKLRMCAWLIRKKLFCFWPRN